MTSSRSRHRHPVPTKPVTTCHHLRAVRPTPAPAKQCNLKMRCFQLINLPYPLSLGRHCIPRHLQRRWRWPPNLTVFLLGERASFPPARLHPCRPAVLCWLTLPARIRHWSCLSMHLSKVRRCMDYHLDNSQRPGWREITGSDSLLQYPQTHQSHRTDQ